MDSVIAGFPAVADRDLMLCPDHGVAYQGDMSSLVPYDDAYFDKCAGYEDQEIANKINAGRVALVNQFVGPESVVCDVGIGSGEFIKSRPSTWGHDVNPKAIAWLKEKGRWAQSLAPFWAFTFWDVIEHVPEPQTYFSKICPDAHLFTSIPVFRDLDSIRQSKHYRPNEHLYYWTESGFVAWMALHGFRLLDRRDFESVAGREAILSFAFRRDFA